MPQIGVRQLRDEASEIIRSVHEEKVEYIITLRGRPVAVLSPIEPATEDADEILALAAGVFAGLQDAELAEIEAAIRRRPDFFGESTGANQ